MQFRGGIEVSLFLENEYMLYVSIVEEHIVLSTNNPSSSHTRLTFSHARPPVVPKTRWQTLRRDGSDCAAAIIAVRSGSVTRFASLLPRFSDASIVDISPVSESAPPASECLEAAEAPPTASSQRCRSVSSISGARTFTVSRPETTQKIPAPLGGGGSADGGTVPPRSISLVRSPVFGVSCGWLG